MKLSSVLAFASLFVAAAVLTGCASRPPDTKAVADYLAFVRSHPGADLHGAEEKAAIARFETFLSSFTAEKVRADTRRVYAPEAFLNDSLKTVRGAAAIEDYFLGSVKNTESITVAFTDVARSHNDYYFRWVMDVRFKLFHRGRTVRTIGMTHVRFDRRGRVLLHQDYWDSAQGLFEYVPGIGGGIHFLKSRL